MNRYFIYLIGLICAVSFSTGTATAVDLESIQIREAQQTQEMDQERDMFGWELMTPEERDAHRAKLRSLKTKEEREAYRMAHHQKMQERAKEKGVTLPEMPMHRGRGMGPGGGMGGGGGRNR